MAFRSYDKIYRLGTSETDGILKGTLYVSPKLDGTNASVWTEGERLNFGSRTRHLVGTDNAGFKAAHMENENILCVLLNNPTWRLYGEWLVPHTIKGYEKGAWKKFYVFDVYNGYRYLEPIEWEPILLQNRIDFIPHNILRDPTIEEVEATLALLSDKYMVEGEKGEGIVLKNFGFINKFGVMAYAKYINEGFQNRPKKVAYDTVVEDDLANNVVTEGMVHKVAHKIMVAEGADGRWDRGKMIPRLIETVFHDLITEKLYDQLKCMKNPTVNFKLLKGSVSRAIRDNGKEYF